MLKESFASQKEPDIFRRWFDDDYFDLIIWYDTTDRSITGIQLCYDKKADEHAFMWHRASGFSHHAIDDTRSHYKHPASPLLVDDGIFPFEEIIGKFRERSENIDPSVRDFVIAKLEEYSKTMREGTQDA